MPVPSSNLPDWATDANYGNGHPTKITAPGTQLQSGWKGNQKPPPQWLNWWMNLTGLWVNWFRRILTGDGSTAGDVVTLQARVDMMNGANQLFGSLSAVNNGFFCTRSVDGVDGSHTYNIIDADIVYVPFQTVNGNIYTVGNTGIRAGGRMRFYMEGTGFPIILKRSNGTTIATLVYPLASVPGQYHWIDIETGSLANTWRICGGQRYM